MYIYIHSYLQLLAAAIKGVPSHASSSSKLLSYGLPTLKIDLRWNDELSGDARTLLLALGQSVQATSGLDSCYHEVVHTHTHTYTHVHTHTHINTHTYTHTHTHAMHELSCSLSGSPYKYSPV